LKRNVILANTIYKKIERADFAIVAMTAESDFHKYSIFNIQLQGLYLVKIFAFLELERN